eukprot:12893195-Prorocentrum_lima.AAC.1
MSTSSSRCSPLRMVEVFMWLSGGQAEAGSAYPNYPEVPLMKVALRDVLHVWVVEVNQDYEKTGTSLIPPESG